MEKAWSTDPGAAEPNEGESSAAAAVPLMRLELLCTAVAYGVYACATADEVAQWGEWLAWVESLAANLAEATRSSHRVDLPWLEAARAFLVSLPDREESDPSAASAIQEWASAAFEAIAARARPIDRTGGDPLGLTGSDAAGIGARLLNAVQDSLILATSRDKSVRDKRAGSAELLALLDEARAKGVWAPFES